MIEYQQKKAIRKIMYSKFTLSVLFVVLMFFTYNTYNLWQKYRDTNRALDNQRGELEVLNQKQTTLEDRIESLKTEKGVEEAIREKFKVAKQGEGVVVVIDQKDKEGENILENPIKEFFFRLLGL